jgi:hypothetical protein
MSESLNRTEDALLGLVPENMQPQPVFILGAPRTGSTYLYQLVASRFQLPYISNLTNDCFSTAPIIGLAIQHGIAAEITDSSHFGKTLGPFQPSEGSSPMSHWFGGGHPSQDVSNTILPGREKHFQSTLAACEYLYGGAPLLIKNPWNCFRVSYLASVLPQARFIWLKRDIRQAAASDLEARYLTKGSATAWNSATPSNLEQLRLRPPTDQVVENQYEFNEAIGESFAAHPETKWCELWYEDLIQSPALELEKLSRFLDRPIQKEPPTPQPPRVRSRELKNDDARLIYTYVDKEYKRLDPFCYKQVEY